MAANYSNTVFCAVSDQCGDETYDPTFAICCDGVLTPLPICGSTDNSQARCCGKRAFHDIANLACCGDNLDLKQGDKSNNACCGGFSFDQGTHLCCQGIVHPKPTLDDAKNQCCRTRAYNTDTNTCDASGRLDSNF